MPDTSVKPVDLRIEDRDGGVRVFRIVNRKVSKALGYEWLETIARAVPAPEQRITDWQVIFFSHGSSDHSAWALVTDEQLLPLVRIFAEAEKSAAL